MDPVIRKRLQYSLIAGAGLLVLLLIFILFNTALYNKITVHATPYTDENFTVLQGSSMYSYNGAGFYRVDPKTSEIKILNSSSRLPSITKLFWAGDKGALMTFGDESFSGSDIERALIARGIPADTDSQTYAWYLDFQSGRLSLVHNGVSDLLRVWYSEKTNQFYFVAQVDGAPGDPESEYITSYFSYPLGNESAKTLISNVGFDEVSFIGPCEETKACVLQTGEELKLWTEVGGKKQTVYDFKDYDSAAATGISDTFIVTKNDPVATTEDSEDEQLQSSPSLLNLDGKITPLDAKTSANTPLIANSLNTKASKNYVIDTATKDTESTSHYLSTGKTLLGVLKAKQYKLQLGDGADFKSHVLGKVSYGDNGTALFTDIDHRVFYVTDQSDSFNLAQVDEKNLESSIKQCLDKYTTFHEYTSDIKLLRVGVKFDENYTITSSSFSKCVATVSPQAFIGYNFSFVGIDPESGRFVTN